MLPAQRLDWHETLSGNFERGRSICLTIGDRRNFGICFSKYSSSRIKNNRFTVINKSGHKINHWHGAINNEKNGMTTGRIGQFRTNYIGR